MSIKQNIKMIRENIARAEASGAILLVAATKMNDADAVKEAIACGVDACGENRVQEFLEKNEKGAYSGAPIHFIGHLQRNKVKQIVGKVDLIQSVDSKELLTLISNRAKMLGITQDLLIEINVAGEEQKSGIAASELSEILRYAAEAPNIRIRGLMCVPPVTRNAEENIPYFDQMRQLFIDNGDKKYDNVFMDFLSMGMTGDYVEAVKAGANMVRIGSAIFGERDYSAAN